MGKNSSIEWTHHTFNPWRGCTKVSEGCRNCYAERDSKRNLKVLGQWGPNGTRVVASEAMWEEPLKWDRAAAKAAARHRVFCASLADVFEGPETMPDPAVGDIHEARVRLFNLVEQTPNLDWLLLTKRPQHVVPLAPRRWDDGWPPNVWVGTSAENQQAADERIPHLLRVPAVVRFLSCEPLLGPVDLTRIRLPLGGESFETRSALHGTDSLNKGKHTPGRDQRVDWVIVGGESGPNARPMCSEWARSLRDQCVNAGVAFHFKQFGEWMPNDQMDLDDHVAAGVIGLQWATFDAVASLGAYRVGKKKAGRVLDGRTWDELPAAKPEGSETDGV